MEGCGTCAHVMGCVEPGVVNIIGVQEGVSSCQVCGGVCCVSWVFIEPWQCMVNVNRVSKKVCKVIRCVVGCVAKFVCVCVFLFG